MPLRFFRITVPEDRLKVLMRVLRSTSRMHGIPMGSIGKVHASNSFIVTFRCTQGASIGLLGELERAGIGVRFGMIDVLPLDLTKPRLPQPPRVSMRWDRLTVEEIYDAVKSQNNLGFDNSLYLVAASVIAGVGLASDSATTVIAAMLVSPIMNAILAFTLAPLLRKRALFWNGMFYLAVMLVGSYMIGVALGYLFLVFSGRLNWPTREMASRGDPVALVFGTMVALPSGVGVALSVSSGGVNSLVGVAISASLLPPCVNAGMLTVYGMFAPLMFRSQRYPDALLMAIYSSLLVLVNIICISFAAVIVFRIKALARVKNAKSWKELRQAAVEDPLKDPAAAANYEYLNEIFGGTPGAADAPDSSSQGSDEDGGGGDAAGMFDLPRPGEGADGEGGEGGKSKKKETFDLMFK